MAIADTRRSHPSSVPEATITLAPPPSTDYRQGGATSWLQYLFPVVGSLGGLLFIANNPKPLYVASGGLFILGSIGMGVGMAIQQRASAARRKDLARANYLDYLGKVRSQLRSTAGAQVAVSAWRHPPPSGLLSVARSPERRWERRPDHADFLQLRVGTGAQRLATTVTVSHQDGPGPTPDPICATAVEEMLTARNTVPGVALGVDLKALPLVSISGHREERLALARAMLCELAVMHSPDDVRVVIEASGDHADDWEWAKWIPHADGDSRAPWTVVFVDGDGVAAKKTARVAQVVLEPVAGDVTVVLQGDRVEIEPRDHDTPRMEGRPDGLGRASAEAIARQLAPYRPARDKARSATVTGEISLPALLRIKDVAQLDPREAWRPRPIDEILSIPIGVSGDGDPLHLDFKEAALGGDGPHGLVIGATGSGKSELLRTVVTALALTHPPDRLAFVLVDFKGGAAFAGLQELPHVAGLITNLADDLALVDRMHAALFGEIRRRQELLRAAGNLPTVREYHRRIDAGESLPPLPYLLLIVDEFGELLTARPDFIDLFVAVGRLGRSLGIHLLLASQQLDEGRLRGLEGHLSYRIALRTFSAAESRAVLGTPDAYELPPLPGSGYLKVGTTVYTRFRAAVVSQPYRGPAVSASASRARPFHASVQAAAGDPSPAAVVEAALETTVLEVAVGLLRDAAPEAHQVWLPPLEPRLTLDAVINAKDLPRMVVPVGLIDRPAEQARGILAIDLSGSAGHLLVAGASLTGKTTLLRTLVCALALTHTPLEAQVYCIDFGGGGLAQLASLPHVGGVAGRQDPERVRRTVVEIAGQLDAREAKFALAGIDSVSTLRARRAAGELEGVGWADIFLVIDNWPAVRQEFEDLESLVQEIASRGLGYAVHVLLTTNRWSDVRSALRESIGGRLELRLHDPMESAINRREAENVARGVPGRGITAEALHFQVALPRIDGRAETVDQQAGLEQLVESVRRGWDGPRAAPVLVLPRLVELSQLHAEPGARGIPIGLAESDLKPVYLDLSGADPSFLVFGDGEAGKTNLLRTYLLGLARSAPPGQAQILLVDYRRTLLGVVPAEHLVGYGGAEPAAAAQVAEVAGVLTRRLPPADLSIDQLRTRGWWKGPDVYVVVDDYDLVVTPSGNPLLPLLPLLAQAKDIGLHLVIARRAGGAGRGVLEQLLLRLRELGSPGLLLSGDPQEGPLLGASRASPQPPGRGILIRRHEKPALIQVAFSGPDAPASG